MQLLSTAVLAAGDPPLIDLDGTFWVQLLIFFIAFLILKTLVFKPMVNLFEAREEAIEGARIEAKRVEREAGEKATTFEEEMRKVRIEAGAERDRLRGDGARLERQLLEKVRQETQQTFQQAEQKLSSEASKVRSDMKATIPVLAKDIAKQLLGREVS